MANVYKAGPFAGVPVTDAFAEAAQRESPIIYHLPSVPWPNGLRPVSTSLGKYRPGEAVTAAVEAPADVLIVLYTDPETMAFLDVWTGNPAWDPSVKVDWCPYAHNFAKFKKLISNPNANDTLKSGAFGLLSAMKLGTKNVVLYKSELHPKQDGTGLPFVPVMQQLIGELAPKLVITTGTAGAIGNRVECGDVTVCTSCRLHLQKKYPSFPDLDTLSANNTQLSSAFPNAFDGQYLQYAATHLTQLSLPGLGQCYQRLQRTSGFSFVPQNTLPPSIYAANRNPVPGPQPMDVVSADYMTADDNHNAEGLQPLGIMNETDDGFLFFAVDQLPAAKRPLCVSVRNASEPQMQHAPFPSTTPPGTIVHVLSGMAGTIYGIYQYCTTLNSALACWGVVAGI
jgi:hypothetical protein